MGNLGYSTKVTDDYRLEMGIAIRPTHRTPAPVPTTYPIFTIDSSVIRRLTVNFRDQNSNRKAKPAGVSGAMIRWAILDTVPKDVEALINSALDPTSPFTLDFTESQRGKKVYFCLSWQNTKGEKGPWSEIGVAIVP